MLGCPVAFRPYLPAGHGVQDAAPGREYVPSGQTSHPTFSKALATKRPAEQDLQSACPGDFWYVPGKQGMQNGLVSFSWWYPFGHASHDVLLLAAWKRPAAQGAQSVARAYLDSFWNLPGEHVTHAEEAPSRRR